MRAATYMNDIPGETVKVINGQQYCKGDKVILKLGKRRSDIADMLLDGKTATVEMIYTDYDDNIHIAVTMNDDPGQELQREMGIYRYFGPDEIEPKY